MDAIDIVFANTPAFINGTLGLLNGSIDISRSFASLAAQADPIDPGPDPIPEPSSMAVLTAALAGFMAVRRRRLSSRVSR